MFLEKLGRRMAWAGSCRNQPNVRSSRRDMEAMSMVAGGGMVGGQDPGAASHHRATSAAAAPRHRHRPVWPSWWSRSRADRRHEVAGAGPVLCRTHFWPAPARRASRAASPRLRRAVAPARTSATAPVAWRGRHSAAVLLPCGAVPARARCAQPPSREKFDHVVIARDARAGGRFVNTQVRA